MLGSALLLGGERHVCNVILPHIVCINLGSGLKGYFLAKVYLCTGLKPYII